MKIVVDRDLLIDSLQLISNVVERRQTLPVLSNMRLVVKGGQLEMVGTDLEIELQASLTVNAESDGEITVPAKKISDIWRSLPSEQPIVMEQVGDRLKIKSGGSSYSLSTIAVSEFPESLGDIEGESIEINSEKFRRSVEEVAFAMAQQDVRYFLNGMLIEIGQGKIKLVATDGHRLALTEMDVGASEDGGGVSQKAIIPRKGVLELLKILDGSEKFSLQISDKLITVRSGNYQFTSKLVEGQFPDYNKVVPQGGGTELTIERQSLREALQRASILSNEKYRGIRLLVDKGSLKIQANNPEQEEAEEVLEISYDGGQLEIGFNVSYILDVLGAISGSEAKLTLSDGNSSALIEGLDDSNSLYVVMPMRL